MTTTVSDDAIRSGDLGIEGEREAATARRDGERRTRELLERGDRSEEEAGKRAD